MNSREQAEYKKKLEKYEMMAEWEQHLYKQAKERYPNFAQPIQHKLTISGLHVELSNYEKPIWKGFSRGENAVKEGIEKKQESIAIKQQMDEEIEALISKYPDMSVTKNSIALEELAEIKRKYSSLLFSRTDNNKRKIRALKSKIQANFDEWTHFVTLTFRDNLYDTDKAKKRFEKWVEKMKEIYPNFKYIYVLEFQERGACHFHVLCSMDKGKRVAKAKFIETTRTWKHGNIDIAGINYKHKNIPKEFRKEAKKELRELSVSEKIKTIWSVGNYLTSYLEKGADSVLLFNKKMYGCSSGLKEEIVVTDTKKIAQILGELGIEQYKEKTYEVYIKETDNTVIKKFYNMLIKNNNR